MDAVRFTFSCGVNYNVVHHVLIDVLGEERREGSLTQRIG